MAEDKNTSSFWQERIKEVTKGARYTAFKKQGENIEKRYRNEEENKDKVSLMKNGYPLMFSNYKTLKPYLCPYIPNIIVDRANKDKDNVARVSSEILERCVNEIVERASLKEIIDGVKFDACLPGLGALCYRDWETDRKSTRLNSSHSGESRMPSSA